MKVEQQIGKVYVELGALMLRSLLSYLPNKYCASGGLRVVSQSVVSATAKGNQSEALLVNDGLRRYLSRIGEWYWLDDRGGNVGNKGVKLHGRRLNFDSLLDLLGLRFERRQLLFYGSRLCGWHNRGLSLFHFLLYNR